MKSRRIPGRPAWMGTPRKYVGWLGVLAPLFAYLLDLAPPLFPWSWAVASAGAATMMVTTSSYAAGESMAVSRRGIVCVAVALLIALFYGVMLSVFTVAESDARFQIGFHKASWSLTREGALVKAMHPDDSPGQWMMNDALFSKDGPAKLWHQWSINSTFLLMAGALAAAAVLWAYGWTQLTRVEAGHTASMPTRNGGHAAIRTAALDSVLHAAPAGSILYRTEGAMLLS